MITKQSIFAWIHDLARVYKENRQYLTRLDSAIGDADHGINMDRGFTKVLDKLPDVEEKGLSDILKTVGMTLVSTVGGASGPLYAAAEAAEQGMQATIPLQARKGRASYLGERSIGHQDPGATSTYLLFKSAAETWSDE